MSRRSRIRRRGWRGWGGIPAPSGGDPGGAFDPFSQAIFEAFTTPPTAERQIIIDTAVKALVAGGVWDNLDALYMLAAADSQAALINWKNPGTYDGTLANAPTFVADQGFTGNGSNAEIDTGFNPSSAPAPNYVQDDACIFGRVRTAGDGLLWGAGSPTFIGFYETGAYLIRLNNGNGANTTTMARTGFISVSRSSGAAQDVYHTGALVESDADVSNGVPGATIKVLSNGGTFSNVQMSSFGVGGALTAPQQAALAAAELAYMQAVGAV